MKKVNYILTIGLTILSSLQTFSQCGIKTKTEWEQYFKDKRDELDPIEGIWSTSAKSTFYGPDGQVLDNSETQPNEEVIYKDGSEFKSCYLGENNFSKLSFGKTAVSEVYIFKIDYPKYSATSSGNAVLSNGGILSFINEMPTAAVKGMVGGQYESGMAFKSAFTMIKLFPLAKDLKKHGSSSGTGFAISSNGIIITNNHVVRGATKIMVKGINGDFSKSYKAKIIIEDKNNDLSLIQIEDANFSTLGAIPYLIPTKTVDVGTSVFVLGYPLRATMGDEIKLTNGIVSSKSGFQGDVTSYQISAPVQPGNSGGPLFDSKGNIIGIINAKHLGAENVSYGIKSSYIINLIELMNIPPKLQTVSTLNTKPLTEQAKVAKKFTYIIEVSYE